MNFTTRRQYEPETSMSPAQYYKATSLNWTAPYPESSSTDRPSDINTQITSIRPTMHPPMLNDTYNPSLRGLSDTGAFIPDDDFHDGTTDVQNGKLSVNSQPIGDHDRIHEEDLYTTPALRDDPERPMTIPSTGHEPEKLGSRNQNDKSTNQNIDKQTKMPIIAAIVIGTALGISTTYATQAGNASGNHEVAQRYYNNQAAIDNEFRFSSMSTRPGERVAATHNHQISSLMNQEAKDKGMAWSYFGAGVSSSYFETTTEHNFINYNDNNGYVFK